MLHFARYLNPELRHDTPLCRYCFNTLGRLYRFKIKNALKHNNDKKPATSISDVISSQRPELISSSNPTATTSTTAAANPPPVPVHTNPSEERMPTTRAAAAEKRKHYNPPPAAQQESNSSYVSDDDDRNSNLSLNAVNCTRLPHIQPIPKRRTVHLNKEAMAIYLAGTTGG
ncbi:uncharacterized protein LOC117579077 [Drosophila guanche]|uniref:Uncharacterized protein n=1 Tax=Drosophila guanche TaxID=7266 RepID=A0A3B0JLA1_DROGU|nr:uncharacterized protein LOC117579077 [Drosophila guanche]SPP76170.1 Hypothetical predicted protein [Drosophila guanche]